MNVAVIAASGKGRRFGAPGGKQFTQLRGRPMLAYALEAFTTHDAIDAVVVVVNREDAGRLAAVLHELPSGAPVEVAFGGAERFDSVRAGLEAARRVAGDRFEGAVVLVHDGARPLVSDALIARVIEAAREAGAAVPCVPVADTVKEVEGERVVATLERARLRAVQTPQGFLGRVIAEAFERAAVAADPRSFTDDAQVVEWAGFAVRCVPGDPANVKLTVPEDAVVVEALLAARARMAARRRDDL